MKTYFKKKRTISFIFIFRALNTTVRGRKDIEDNVSIPFLGEIPAGEKYGDGEDKNSLAVSLGGRDALSKAFRIMWTNMDFMGVQGKRLQVVMFTSTNPGSGKIFVSTNLAMSFALTDKKVILIDTDIRKGTISKNLENDGGKGLTHYLSGKREMEEIVTRSAYHENLETSCLDCPVDLPGMIYEIMLCGYTPVLAHPERYVYMERKMYRLLRDRGCRFQMNLLSLGGFYGKSVAIRCRE